MEACAFVASASGEFGSRRAASTLATEYVPSSFASKPNASVSSCDIASSFPKKEEAPVSGKPIDAASASSCAASRRLSSTEAR